MPARGPNQRRPLGASVALRALTLAALLSILLGACGPAQPRAGSESSPAPESNRGRTLLMVMRGEAPSLAAKVLQATAGVGGPLATLFNATLDFVDENALPHPSLAEALPTLNTDTWRVLPDGRMETKYRLKPNLTWHDGQRLTAEDFVFAYRVYATPALGVSGSLPIGVMEDIIAADDLTLVIRWRQLYASAGVLKTGFQALPRHILQQPFGQLDSQAFANHAFWNTEYIGLGPYRLEQWEPGIYIQGVAFPGHVLGAPRIERIRTVVMNDPQAATAALLSSAADIVTDFVFMQEQGAALEREWGARGLRGTVLYSPVLYRTTFIQLRPEYANPRAILDVRVRRALAHLFDKQTIGDTLIGGKALVADRPVTSSKAAYAAEVEKAVTKYPYDPRQAQRLLEDAGLARGSDGFYRTAGGEPVQPEIRFITNPTQASENAFIVDSMRRAGVDAQSFVVPLALLGDGEFRTTFAAMYTTGGGGGENAFANYRTSQINGPQNRWQGANQGGWVSEEFDRVWNSFNTSLSTGERVREIVEMERILSEEVPFVPHYYTPVITAFNTGLCGPVTRSVPEAGVEILHVHLWHWC